MTVEQISLRPFSFSSSFSVCPLISISEASCDDNGDLAVTALIRKSPSDPTFSNHSIEFLPPARARRLLLRETERV